MYITSFLLTFAKEFQTLTYHIMIGILIILTCWAIGNLISLAINGFVSGNIIGMLLLYAMLHFRLIKADRVAPTAKFLLGIMAIFFVPFGVGLMESYTTLASNLSAIVISCAISTLAVIATVALVYIKLRK